MARLASGGSAIHILQELEDNLTYAMIDLHLHIGVVALVGMLGRIVELDVISFPADLMHDAACRHQRLRGEETVNEFVSSREVDRVRVIEQLGLVGDDGGLVHREEAELRFRPVSVLLASRIDRSDVDR